MTYKEILKKLSKETGFTKKEIEKIYKMYYWWINETISSLPLKSDLTKEEFDKLPTSFPITRLGRYYCTYDYYKKLREKYKTLTHEIKKDKTNG